MSPARRSDPAACRMSGLSCKGRQSHRKFEEPVDAQDGG